ncbi:MAG: DPP IV N-terminal domain-containing protein [Gammaproteobacteria bacterium]
MSRKYQKAKDFLPWNLENKVFNSTIFSYWAAGAFYYFQQSSVGTSLLKVDMNTGEKEVIFNFQKLLDALSSELKDKVTLDHLPLDIFSIEENPLHLKFSYQGNFWSYDVREDICIKKYQINPAKLFSPDNNWSVFINNHNLILSDLRINQDLQLTTDGERYYDYSSSPETNTHAVTQHLIGGVSAPVALWSSDSSKIITHKLDQRNVKKLSLAQNSPEGSQRPKVHSYRMSFSGDENLPQAELIIVDVESKSITPLKTDPLLSPYLTPLEFNWVWWSSDNKKIYFLRETRGSKELMLCVADAETGVTRILISETNETFVEPSQLAPWPKQVLILEESQEIIWLSERDGYSHLYLFDLSNGSFKNAITKGDWCIREVHFYDENEKWLYFTACGYHENEDPYYKHLFRCHLDGSDLQCLTEKNVNHTICISPQKNYFLDTYSTIDSAPISLLKKMDGEVICHLETANIEGLTELGWVPPKRFCVKARDGITKIYGNLYFPSDFDSNKKYPIIDHIYPGPQFYRTPTHFNLYGCIFRSAWTAQALAELGFIVIHVDGFGTPGRSKGFHDASYKNMSDCGIPDHVSAIKQLASMYSFIDLDKVGITGYSGGGYAAARAMLMYPEFFKVSVAAAGNHDLRCYPASYGEKYNSLDIATYADQSNAAHADKLKGKLLLVHGEMDDNVHPCATLQLVDALIKNDKDFDMLIMPNQNHASTFDHPYYMRRHWDYFVRNLLGEVSPMGFSINPMPLDFPQLMDW